LKAHSLFKIYFASDDFARFDFDHIALPEIAFSIDLVILLISKSR